MGAAAALAALHPRWDAASGYRVALGWGCGAPGLFSANASGMGVAAAVVLRRNAAGQDTFEAVSRVEGGSIVSVPIDLASSDARSKGLDLNLLVAGDVPAGLVGD